MSNYLYTSESVLKKDYTYTSEEQLYRDVYNVCEQEAVNHFGEHPYSIYAFSRLMFYAEANAPDLLLSKHTSSLTRIFSSVAPHLRVPISNQLRKIIFKDDHWTLNVLNSKHDSLPRIFEVIYKRFTEQVIDLRYLSKDIFDLMLHFFEFQSHNVNIYSSKEKVTNRAYMMKLLGEFKEYYLSIHETHVVTESPEFPKTTYALSYSSEFPKTTYVLTDILKEPYGSDACKIVLRNLPPGETIIYLRLIDRISQNENMGSSLAVHLIHTAVACGAIIATPFGTGKLIHRSSTYAVN